MKSDLVQRLIESHALSIQTKLEQMKQIVEHRHATTTKVLRQQLVTKDQQIAAYQRALEEAAKDLEARARSLRALVKGRRKGK